MEKVTVDGVEYKVITPKQAEKESIKHRQKIDSASILDLSEDEIKFFSKRALEIYNQPVFETSFKKDGYGIRGFSTKSDFSKESLKDLIQKFNKTVEKLDLEDVRVKFYKDEDAKGMGFFTLIPLDRDKERKDLFNKFMESK